MEQTHECHDHQESGGVNTAPDECPGDLARRDIEGAEVNLLAGELPGVRAICVECHPEVVRPTDLTQMLAALFDQGFALDLGISQGQVLYLERCGEAAG